MIEQLKKELPHTESQNKEGLELITKPSMRKPVKPEHEVPRRTQPIRKTQNASQASLNALFANQQSDSLNEAELMVSIFL